MKDFVIATVTNSGDGPSGTIAVLIILGIWIAVLLIVDFLRREKKWIGFGS